MNPTETLYDALTLDVKNIGGINEASVELSNGVTVLKGKNATNRTSLLQAIMAAMGSDNFNLKGDADHGHVRLTLGGTVVEREFNRRNGTVESTGEGYLEDSELANLFAFLLEDNDARRAVARAENLREIITRPIDTDEINAEIERLQAEKQNLDKKIEHVEERERDIVDLEQRKTRLKTDIEERRERLAELEAEIDDVNSDLESEQKRRARIDGKLDELKELRSQLDDIRFQIETIEETIESLQAEREEKENACANIEVDSEADTSALQDELDELREQQRRIDSQMNELQRIIQFNEEMLGGTDSDIADILRVGTHESDNRDLTAQLLESQETVVCWTCGTEVPRDEIETTLDRLRSFRQDKLDRRQTIQREIDQTNEQISELEDAQRERERLNRRLKEIDTEIEQKQSRITDLEADRENLRDEIEALEAEVEQDQTSDYGDLIDLHKRANEVELELEQKQSELDSTRDEIEEIESLIDDRQGYQERREQISEQLTELRNRIEQLERNAVEQFNSHVNEVLDILEYENIARIWIERKERETRQGRRKTTEGHFELHIVRESESGQTYEGTVETLSESEREVVGLLFALAGYLVYELHETVPLMLMDSLEAIDADRIARLVDYFAEYANFLIVALLPEDANAIDIGYETVTEI